MEIEEIVVVQCLVKDVNDQGMFGQREFNVRVCGRKIWVGGNR